MSKTVETILLIGLLVTAAGTIGSAMVWLMWPRLIGAIRAEIQPMQAQVAETHKQVTENHHSNEQPTVLDRIDDVHKEQKLMRKDFNDHLILASRADADMWRAIEAIAKGQPPAGL